MLASVLDKHRSWRRSRQNGAGSVRDFRLPYAE